jgi:hypothetical protein
VRYLKNHKFNNLSKTVEIFQREPKKMIKLVKKVVKNRRYLVIFSTKARYYSLDSLNGASLGNFEMSGSNDLF